MTITGRHVFIALVAFFGIVFAVNGIMIRSALSTYSGVVADEPYRKGLKYNERIAADERQAERGWRDEIALEAGGRRLSVLLSDPTGAPVRGLAVTVVLGRPATVRDDITLALIETSPGRYEAPTAISAPGSYVASLEAVDPGRPGNGIVYRARKRLWER